ncbi:hypothetical protein [Rhodococcus sp. H29-C3]|nr:hypothetical protein [Rhodococcus sp. H29-C3]MDJ0359600.1 hypothetical protein [Rhodococcus sp. H29-C3]
MNVTEPDIAIIETTSLGDRSYFISYDDYDSAVELGLQKSD